MNLSDAIRKRILDLMKQNNIKAINTVANLAGISNSLHDFMSGKAELLQLDTILHICEAFHIQLYEFFYDPLFIDALHEKSNNNLDSNS